MPKEKTTLGISKTPILMGLAIPPALERGFLKFLETELPNIIKRKHPEYTPEELRKPIGNLQKKETDKNVQENKKRVLTLYDAVQAVLDTMTEWNEATELVRYVVPVPPGFPLGPTLAEKIIQALEKKVLSQDNGRVRKEGTFKFRIP
jgi:hypothetical protein